MLRTLAMGLRRDFSDIFGFHDEDAKGRTVYIFCVILNAFYNVFITGVFYTGFLSMNGMSITDAGVITFIPYLGNLFSVFSSKILRHFRRRKPIMIAAKIYFYAMYILAATVMPRFVLDPQQRLYWFAAIVFLAYALYAPFDPGFVIWFYRFFPQDDARRSRYLLYQQIAASIISSVILIFSSVITDAVTNAQNQRALIDGLRYFAFALVLLEIAIQVQAKEYPVPPEEPLRLAQVFALPLRYKKFMYCTLVMFAWNYISNLNNGLWNYHLLNHMQFSYTLINAMSVLYTVILLSLSGFWQRVLARYSWIRTFGLAQLIWVPTEFLFFAMSPETAWLYVPLCFVQNVLTAGINLSYANVLYMNLPRDNETALIAFNTLGRNFLAFLGLLTGTYVSSITGDATASFMGMQVYSVQFTCLLRAATLFALGMILVLRWRSFTPDADVAALEEADAVRKRLKDAQNRRHV
ncbi:MAG: MFS transporter [Clostridiales bacterium]|nr:MFS transporter [Clostridiales bacterium]